MLHTHQVKATYQVIGFMTLKEENMPISPWFFTLNYSEMIIKH